MLYFLSNFYKPGVTKVSDLKGSALAEEVSSKFFESSGNASEVQKYTINYMKL